jgi:hypothetical protein
MTNKDIKILREKIAGLSSGVYYDEVYHWYSKLKDILVEQFGVAYIDDCPQIYNDEGRQVTNFTDPNTQMSYCVFWTYFRMQSGRWEIICYLT